MVRQYIGRSTIKLLLESFGSSKRIKGLGRYRIIFLHNRVIDV